MSSEIQWSYLDSDVKKHEMVVVMPIFQNGLGLDNVTVPEIDCYVSFERDAIDLFAQWRVPEHFMKAFDFPLHQQRSESLPVDEQIASWLYEEAFV